jgi:hypothetical protein
MKKFFVVAIVGILVFAAASLLAQRGSADLSDLIVSKIEFQKVDSGKDSDGHTYWIFNVLVTIKNQGKGNAGPFDVLLERNNGAGKSFQVACQTCTLHVAGLATGAEKKLDPRQFNNANDAPSSFRATVDSGHSVTEGNEQNNQKTETFVSLAAGDFEPVPQQLMLPDLIVTDLAFQNVTTSTSNGSSYVRFDLAATVKNQGKGKAPACMVTFLKSSDAAVAGTPITDSPVPALAAGAQAVVVQPGITYKVGNPDLFYRAHVDYMNMVKETDDTNNFKVAKLPGY